MKHLMFAMLGVIMLLTSACEWKKYESGPTVSVLTPRERVTNTWRWKLALVDGQNLTGSLQDSTISFTKDQVIQICGPEGGCRTGKWDLVRKNTKINIIFGEQAQSYDIELLRFDEMWLRSTEGGQDIEWDLVPIDSEE